MNPGALIGAALALAACDRPLLGMERLVEFTPDDCGMRSCDLTAGIASDSTLAILLEHVDDDEVLPSVVLESGEPRIVEVTGETGILTPRFRIKAHAPGEARLVVFEADPYVGVEHLDWIPVNVVRPDDIALEISGAGEREVIDGRTDRYRFRVGDRVHIRSRPVAEGRELAGETVYSCTLSAGLTGTTTESTNLVRGEIEVRPPSGTHVITIQLSTGAIRAIELTSI